MSARNYGQKNNSRNNYLPNIAPQRHNYSNNRLLSCYSATSRKIFNRNVSYPGNRSIYVLDDSNRVPSPISDFWSESDTGTGTPDFNSEESDSSTGSVLRKVTAEASKLLAEEWERIERTIYDEEGEKVTRPQMLEECNQWRALFPQLRVVGKSIPLPERKLSYRNIEPEEIFAIHYSDYEQFSESEERRSQSSTDTTPQNSPRRISFNDSLESLTVKGDDDETEYFDDEIKSNDNTLERKSSKNKNVLEVQFNLDYEPKFLKSNESKVSESMRTDCDIKSSKDSDQKFSKDLDLRTIKQYESKFKSDYEPKLHREKVTYKRFVEPEDPFNDSFSSLLQITPMHPKSLKSSINKRNCSSILKSEMSSSKWMRNKTPDTSTVYCDRNSAKSFYSLDTRNNSLVYSATERNKITNASSVFTARQREGKLLPLYCNELNFGKDLHASIEQRRRKVSLPPLNVDDDKGKNVGSARRVYKKVKVLPYV